MTMRHLMGALMVIFGGMLVGGSVFQWPWFVAGRRYRRWAEAVGPWLPRIVYGVIGIVLMVFGVLQALGLWKGGWDGRG